ncbi:signal peptidase II [Deinococcus kurensis]|uniref:signal peptidase II n=1 Tax=Deinococcus kurensis TaxID=2662757 RepID=UPI0012D2C68E|nr:signal peptidase II [Deinococcus kurensis]
MLRVAQFTWWPLLTGALLITDLLVKSWATQTLPAQPLQPIVPGLLNLTYTLNEGMAWGLLDTLPVPLAALRLLVGLVLIAVLVTFTHAPARALALSLIAAGALSNAIDGLTGGAVVDYLSSPLLDAAHRAITGRNFPIFNGADVLVLAGVLLLLLTLPRSRSHHATQETP